MTPPAVTPPLSPSDLRGRPASSQRLRVAGRVVLAAPGELRVADAMFSLVARGELGAREGDLVVIEGLWNGQSVELAEIVERYEHPTTRAGGEFARLGWDGVGGKLAARAAALRAIRAYFDDQGFLEIDAPARVAAPGVDLNVDALSAEAGFLVTSPELSLKRLLVGGLPRCYSLAHAFRRDERGHLHEPEFLLLEWYRAFSGQEAVMHDTEQVVLSVARAIGAGRLIAPDGRPLNVTPPYPRLSVREAFRRFAGVDDAVALAERDEDTYFRGLVERVEPGLAAFDRPVFLCDYPLSQAALARPSPADPSVAERFELYAGGVELCNGYGELTDPVEQRRRFQAEDALRRAAGRPVYPLNERFLAALEEGMPPAGGNALGVDRLLLLATGAKNLQEVMPQPWEE